MCDKCGRQFRGKAGYVVHVKFCGLPKKKKETKTKRRTKSSSTEACAKPVKQQVVKVDRKDQEPMSPPMPKTKRQPRKKKVK